MNQELETEELEELEELETEELEELETEELEGLETEELEELEKVNLINSFLKFYKRHYGKSFNVNMFDNINYNDFNSTNHCLEMLQKYIDEYYKNIKIDEDYITIFEPSLIPKNIMPNIPIYVLTKKNNEKLLCMSLLPLLKYVNNIEDDWRIDIIKN